MFPIGNLHVLFAPICWLTSNYIVKRLVLSENNFYFILLTKDDDLNCLYFIVNELFFIIILLDFFTYNISVRFVLRLRYFVCRMFALLVRTMLNPSCEYDTDCINTINTWSEPHNANGVTPNTIIDSNDEPAGNNQQRVIVHGY